MGVQLIMTLLSLYDRRQLELPVVLPQLGLLPGLPHVNVTGSVHHMPAFLIFDCVYRREKRGLAPKAEEAISLPCRHGHQRQAIEPCSYASA